MRALVEATLAKLPSKDSMAQWPPEAVATVEVLTKLVLILCDELEARDKRIAELEEDVKGLKRKLNISSGNSVISPSKEARRRTKTTHQTSLSQIRVRIPSQIRKSSPNASREAQKGTRAIVRDSSRRRM